MKFNNEILNYGLELSMEFGANWLKPVNERLKKKFPNLNNQELSEYNFICEEVNNIAHKYVYENQNSEDTNQMIIYYKLFNDFLLDKYNWISEKNLSGLYSQSCYYAWK